MASAAGLSTFLTAESIFGEILRTIANLPFASFIGMNEVASLPEDSTIPALTIALLS